MDVYACLFVILPALPCCMGVCTYICVDAITCMHVCMCVCMHVCMVAFMFVCVCLCVCVPSLCLYLL